MTENIISDILNAFRQYAPYAFTSGAILISIILIIISRMDACTMKHSFMKHKKSWMPTYLLYIYCFHVVSITFLSREPGSRDQIDLNLFSTFSKHWSDNRYPIENILLFIPLGILLPLLWKRFYNLIYCSLISLLFSMLIETSQYITKRGFFQLDDIITNTMGALLGYTIVTISAYIKSKV